MSQNNNYFYIMCLGKNIKTPVFKTGIFLVIVISAISWNYATGVESSYGLHEGADERGDFRIMFYNVENLFDIYNNPEKDDDEFTPGGARNWNFFRFREKLLNIYRVIAAVGGWEPPEIVGLSEVENRYVLDRLINTTPLSGAGYAFIHRDSPDTRGMDVALLYRSDRFTLIKNNFYRVKNESGVLRKTREILYVKGVTCCMDTLHLFVNHWPSRWNGQAATEHLRIMAAKVLRQAVDSVFQTDTYAKIIIMGDFNDEPGDKSLSEILEAQPKVSGSASDRLYNLFGHYKEGERGTIKYRGKWHLFDQIIVSGSLICTDKGMSVSRESAGIFDASFLLGRDEAWFGYKPFRSYEGFRYTGGYSDHLPVYIDLSRINQNWDERK